MRCALYSRVSTNRQEQDETIETQLVTLRDWCEREGVEPVLDLRDEGWSGVSTRLHERPSGRALIEAGMNGEIDTVLVYKRDRLGRGSVAEQAEQALRPYCVRVISVTEPYTKKRMGKRMADFQSGSYADVVRENTMRGRARSVREGKYIMPTAPYGYRKTDDMKLEIRPDTAEVVKRIYQLYLTGIGCQAVCSQLDDAGVPPPAETSNTKRKNRLGIWHKTGVRRILKSTLYKGEWRFTARDPDDEVEHDQVVIVQVPAIIDEGTWDRVQVLMDRRAINGPRTKREYMLQGLLWCGVCNGRLTPVSSKGTTRYKCVRRAHFSKSRVVKQAHEGKRWYWSCKALEEVVKAFINDWMSRPALLAPHVERRLAVEQRQAEGSLAAVNDLQAKLDDKEREEERVLEFGRKGIYQGDQFDRELRTVRDDRDRLRAQLRVASQQAGVVQSTVERLTEFRQQVLELAMRNEVGEWGELRWVPPKTDAGWRMFARYMIDRVIVIGVDDEIDVRFEGILIAPSDDDAESLQIIANPSSRRRG